MTRLFLADHHRGLRGRLRKRLADEPALTVVGEADNGQDLLDQLATTPTDVVVLDLHLPGLDGLATTRRLHEAFPAVRVLILSQETHAHRIGQVLAAGALGYVLRNADQGEIVTAIQAVGQGKRFLSSELGLLLLNQVLSTALGRTDAVLSKREREVLQLVANRLTNAEISAKLFTSKRTIEKHRQNISIKTGAKNTADLVHYAIGRGWLLPG